MNHVDDQDVERTLRRYRPADPRPELRQRVVGVRTARVAPWAAVAAALLATVVLLRMGMANDIEGLAVDVPDPERQRIALLAEALGGDAEARKTAEILVLQSAIRQANALATATERAR
jgi:hypothetical protein